MWSGIGIIAGYLVVCFVVWDYRLSEWSTISKVLCVVSMLAGLAAGSLLDSKGR